MLNVFLGFLMLFLQLPDSSSSPGEFLVKTFTVDDGLPSNTIEDIYQDELGYLYFATLNGLARYDGYKFTIYNSANTPGISTNRLTGFTNRTGEGIWMLTEQYHLTWMNNGTFTTFEDVLTVLTDRDGETWAGTPTGIARYDSVLNDFVKITDLPKEVQVPTRQLISLERGLLIRNDSGIFLEEGGSFRGLLLHPEFPIGNQDWTIMEHLDDDRVLIHSSLGFFVLDLSLEEVSFVQEFKSENFLDIWNAELQNDQIIISAKQGLFELDTVSWEIRRLSVDSYNYSQEAGKGGRILHKVGPKLTFNGTALYDNTDVKNAFLDREGSVWIATPRDGLHQLKSVPIININTVNGQPLENTYPIIQDNSGDIWVGSLINGVYRFNDRGVDHWNSENSALTSNLARYLFEDTDGTIYLALWQDGLWKFTGNDWERERFLTSITNRDTRIFEAMHRDHNKVLIIGNRETSIFKKGDNLITFSDSLGVEFKGVRVIRETKQGTIYMGSIGDGLGILHPDGNFHHLTSSDGLSSDFIRDILVQSKDTIWIATENMGLDRLVFSPESENPDVVSVRQRDGLMDNALHRIIEDRKERWWISSNRGVMWISKKDINAYADGKLEFLPVRKYDEKKGMLNREANGGVMSAGILTSDNKIWVPNQKGVTIFDPTKAGHINYFEAITPVIETIGSEDSLISLSGKETVRLPHGKRNFSVKFTAPNFESPESIRFRYQLTGISDSWQTANSLREASFTNVTSGDHEFRLQVLFPDGQTSLASVQLTVPPFYYETAWFKVLIALSIIGIGVASFRIRIHSLRMREKELQRRVKEQTLQLEQAAEERSRFFTGITHELKTPLSLILGPLDEFIAQNSSKSKKQFQHYLHIMQRNGYRLKNLVDQILDVSKLNAEAIKLDIHPFDIEALTRQIAGQFQSLLQQKSITLDIQSDRFTEPIYVDKEAWERIIINLLSNAIKFSLEGGHIILKIENQLSRIRVSVKDFGKGIAVSDQEKVFEYLYQSEGEKAAEGTGVGLYLVKGLIERMGGSIELRSEEKRGSEFILTLKKGSEHFMKEDHLSHEPVKIDKIKPPSHRIYTTKPEGDNKKSSIGETPTKVLIVEDNPDFRDYLAYVLEGEYCIYVATNGDEGLAIIEEVQPDLVISDVMMPAMGGFEFVSQLREIEGFKQLPVIFLSAKDQDADIQQGLSNGADVYLTKPIRSSTLIAQINAVLRREEVLRRTNPFQKSSEPNEPELVSNLREIIYRQVGNPHLNVDLIAEKLYMSRATLYRSWKPVSDLSVSDFIKKIRLEEAAVLIKEKDFSIQDAAYAVGFTDPNYFSTSFKKHFGVPPSQISQ